MWKEGKGWCVDANGLEAGRGNNQHGFAKADCYAQCESDPLLNGCTFSSPGTCVTYSGNIVRGNGNEAYTCYYGYPGKNKKNNFVGGGI